MSLGPARIAFQGAFGAFSHDACLGCIPDAEPVPFPSFDQALSAVRDRVCETAFLPVENSSAGPVPEMAALLPGCGLSVIGEHRWRIRMQLLAVPGATLDGIEGVSSHPMALKQCRRALAELGVAIDPAYDTAGAAQDLARSGDVRRAVIASRAAADLYGLQVLRADIEDTHDNTTRFLVLSR